MHPEFLSINLVAFSNIHNFCKDILVQHCDKLFMFYTGFSAAVLLYAQNLSATFFKVSIAYKCGVID